MVTIDKRDSAIITFLRFPLIVLVVYAHNGGIGGHDSIHSIADWSGIWQTGIYDIIRLAVRIFSTHATIQCFFIMSGFLYFYNVKEWSINTFWSKSKKRIYTLVIPYILWNMIAMLYPVIVHLFLGIISPAHFEKARFYWDQLDWINSFWDTGTGCPFLFPLWYIRDLIFFCMLTPVLYPLLKGKYGWITLLLLLFIYSFNYIPDSIRFIALFSAGAYLGIHKICISELLIKYKNVICILSAILFVILMIYNLDCGIGRLSVVCIWNIIGSMLMFLFALNLINTSLFRLCCTLSVTVFFILGFHNMDFMYMVDSLVERFYHYNNIWLNIFFYIAIPLIKVGICITVYYSMKKIMPRTLNVLTGGR